MSNENVKTGGGSGDQPILLGQPNDPKLIGKVDLFTGPALDSAIAKLDAFVGGAFSESSDDEPFLFGLGSDEPEETTGAFDDEAPKAEAISESPASVSEDLEAADGLDRILDRLDGEEVPAEEPPSARPLSLLDIEKRFETGEPVLNAPVSPIADILARTSDQPTDFDPDFYDDPMFAADLSDSDLKREESDEVEAQRYDPLAGLQDFDENLAEEGEIAEDGPTEEDHEDLEPLSEEEDPFDALDLIRDGGEPETEDREGVSETGQSYGLPEPTPFSDTSGMSGFFTDDYPETSQGDLSDTDAEPDMIVPDPEPETGPVVQDYDPPTTARRVTTSQGDGSVLDSLFADLRWGGPSPSPSPAGEASSEIAEPVVLPEKEIEPVIEEVAETPAETSSDAEVLVAKKGFIPSFMRLGGGPRPSLFPKPPVMAPEPEMKRDAAAETGDIYEGGEHFKSAAQEPTYPVIEPTSGQISDEAEKEVSWNDDWREFDEKGDDLMPDTQEVAPVDKGNEPEHIDNIVGETAQENSATKRKGPKPLLMGVAAVALLGVGIGGFLLMSGPDQTPAGSGATIIVRTPIGTEMAPPPVSGFEPRTTEFTGPVGADTSDQITDPIIAGSEPVIDDLDPATFAEAAGDLFPSVLPVGSEPGSPVHGEDSPVSEVDGSLVTEVATPDEPVLTTVSDPDGGVLPVEIADLMREIRRPEAPEVNASSEQVLALEGRIAEMDTRLAAAADRSDALSSEMTGLIDQITSALQRNSEQAERIDRMERMIRSQSAILGQIGQMEESLEQTQIVLLDVSARIGRVEGQNPADRDAVNRALSDLESRLQALTANMSILARMSIEGVDALRATGASSGTVGVRTSPERTDPSGGSNTVFQTQQGGFRISSDAAGRVPATVKKDDFIEGYGYVLDVLPASDGQRLVVMENGSVLIPGAN
jgi:hypothetical protein